MQFQFVNTSTVSAVLLDMAFFDSQGNFQAQPILRPSGVDLRSQIRSVVPPGGIEFLCTIPDGVTRIGYAIVLSDPPDALAVYTTFSQAVPGRPLFQTGIPLESTGLDHFFTPFLNTGPSTSSMALVSTRSQQILLIARDFSGTEQCRSQLSFLALEHTAFITHDVLPCTRDRDGVVEVIGETRGVTGVGIMANDDGAFVTQPVYGPPSLIP